MNRRDFMAGLAGIPILGGFFAAYFGQRNFQTSLKENILSEIDLPLIKEQGSDFDKPVKGDAIRLGIIGVGSRGSSILESMGFSKEDIKDHSHADLNIQITAVCDVYDTHAEEGLTYSRFNKYSDSKRTFPQARRYKHYQELLHSNEVDAVIIVSPDHWHAQMIIDTIQAGKHIYCEKCLTRTIEEAYLVYDRLSESKIVFQYGHQNRQQKSYDIARAIIKKGILGKITVIKSHTNRNNQRGAWIRNLGKENTDPAQVDWAQWLGSSPQVPFSTDRFFGWQKYFEYSGGLPAHMFSHEYDALNQVLDLGIPRSVVASGGIYYWKDQRNTPDVLQAVFEYPEKELILTYDATLSSSSTGMYESGAKVKELFGSDAWMRLGLNIDVIPDRHSKRFRQKIDNGTITPNIPFLSYHPGRDSGKVDAITSATEKLYAGQGLVYTFKNGKKVDVTYLHIREWLEAIRTGGKPSGSVQTAFEDAITCLMATKAYREQRRVVWDPLNKKVI